MSKLSALIKWMGKNDPPRPKWRDEKVIMRMFAFPFGFALGMFFVNNHRQFCWAEVALFATVSFLLGNISGHWSGIETDRLFPSGYRWDWKTQSWVKREQP